MINKFYKPIIIILIVFLSLSYYETSFADDDFNTGLLNVKSNKWEEALIYFKKSKDINMKPMANYMISYCCLAIRDFECASEYALIALEGIPHLDKRYRNGAVKIIRRAKEEIIKHTVSMDFVMSEPCMESGSKYLMKISGITGSLNNSDKLDIEKKIDDLTNKFISKEELSNIVPMQKNNNLFYDEFMDDCYGEKIISEENLPIP